MELIFTERFLDRVEACTDYIAADDFNAAVKWARGVFEHCQQLVAQPQSGRMVPEFRRPEIREIIHGNYRLVYEVKPLQIDMLTIWHVRQKLTDDPRKAD